jgi:outer membrane lipoprotein-sorting protein
MVRMLTFTRRPAARWAVPAVAVVVLAGGGSALVAATASAGDKLAPRTAAQLLVDVQQAKVNGLSGTIVENADLGLPSLPGVGGSSASDLTSLVAGSHTLRVWSAGPDHARLSVMGQLGESDVIRNGTDLWTWSSNDKTATHRTLKAHSTTPDTTSPGAGVASTPQQAAASALKAIDPSTQVSTSGTADIAGRSAYVLALTPRDNNSLVGSVQIAIDAETHVPLRVQVFAKGASQPSFEVGFTSFDPTTPAMSVFGFNPPPGTKVTEESGSPSKQPSGTQSGAGKAADDTKVVGSGWTSVVVAKVPADATSGAGGSGSTGQLASLLQRLPKVSGSWGSGHLLQGTLFSVVLTDDGRVAAGAVAPQQLYDALAGQ